DGLSVCADAGAVHAGHAHARAFWEAHLFIDWILEKGKERWARQYYVADIRRELAALRRLIPGTAEHAKFGEMWRECYRGNAPQDAELASKAPERVQQINALLSKPIYADINTTFQNVPTKRNREPDWWF